MEVIIKTKERAVSIQGVEGSSLFTLVIDTLRALGLTEKEVRAGLELNLENKNKKK